MKHPLNHGDLSAVSSITVDTPDVHIFPNMKNEFGVVTQPQMNECDLRDTLGIDCFSAFDYGPQAVQSGIIPANACQFNPINSFGDPSSPIGIDVSQQVNAAKSAILTLNDNQNE